MGADLSGVRGGHGGGGGGTVYNWLLIVVEIYGLMDRTGSSEQRRPWRGSSSAPDQGLRISGASLHILNNNIYILYRFIC
jgi:hypothetical protein